MSSVSIIIPTYHPGRELGELLRRLRAQTVTPGEILIINTGKEFWDPALQRDFPEISVYHIRKGNFDHGGTREWAAEKIRTDFFVMMTQDAMPADRFLLERLLRAFGQDERTGIVYARQLPAKKASPAEKIGRRFNYPPVSHSYGAEDLKAHGIKTFFCSDVCAAYRREAWESAGGFPERILFNEDMICAFHMLEKGYRVAYAADARVIHSHNYTSMQQLRRNFDLGVSQERCRDVFGGISSEGEGLRLVKYTLAELARKKRFDCMPEYLLQISARYLGYRLGKAYRILPERMIRFLTSDPSWWEK